MVRASVWDDPIESVCWCKAHVGNIMTSCIGKQDFTLPISNQVRLVTTRQVYVLHEYFRMYNFERYYNGTWVLQHLSTPIINESATHLLAAVAAKAMLRVRVCKSDTNLLPV
jgi:hypothetical protein